MKRIAVLFLAVLMVVFAVACSKSSYKDATREGYKNEPFIDFLDAYARTSLAKQNEKGTNASFAISYADNWRESSKLSEKNLGQDEQMRTYTIDLVLERNGEIENNQMHFFMGYTPCEKKLTVKGIKMVEDGNEMLEIVGKEAEEGLKEMTKMV